MKKSKSIASSGVVPGRTRVDRAETYPGRDQDQVAGGCKNTAAADATNSNRQGNSHRNSGSSSGGSAGGNGVIKWLKHITDAAESHKRDAAAAKGKRSGQPSTADSPTVHLGTVQEMLVMDRRRTPRNNNGDDDNENSQRQESDAAYNDGRRLCSDVSQQLQQADSWHDPTGQVGVMHFDPPQSVQPNEVKVSSIQVIDEQETKNPVELVKEKNRTIEAALVEKKILLSRILQIPVEDNGNISEVKDVVDEMTNCSDVRELILGSLTQADRLTQFISEQMHLSTHEDGEEFYDASETTDDKQKTPTNSEEVPKKLCDSNPLPLAMTTVGSHGAGRQGAASVAMEIPIVVSSSQLMAISCRLHDNLTALLGIISILEEERGRLKSNDSQLFSHQLELVTSQGHEVNSDLADEASNLPSVSCPPEMTEPMVNRPGQSVECFSSMSIVDPTVNEHLPVVEPEPFVSKYVSTTTNSYDDDDDDDEVNPTEVKEEKEEEGHEEVAKVTNEPTRTLS